MRHPVRPRHLALAAATGLLGAAALAAPAHAHVEVEADKPQAGATDVTVTFTGEAESATAGIASERVVLPAGVSPRDVRLAKAPAGWTLTGSADGFTVGGPALEVGQDAVFSVLLARIPADATRLVFRTVETYGDGKVARWIEVPEAGQPEPENPAPVLTVRAAATPTGTTAAPATSAAVASTPAATPVAPVAAPARRGSATGWWVGLAVLAVALVVGAAVLRRRRRG
jgi:uncharacterized protein YcnI